MTGITCISISHNSHFFISCCDNFWYSYSQVSLLLLLSYYSFSLDDSLSLSRSNQTTITMPGIIIRNSNPGSTSSSVTGGHGGLWINQQQRLISTYRIVLSGLEGLENEIEDARTRIDEWRQRRQFINANNPASASHTLHNSVDHWLGHSFGFFRFISISSVLSLTVYPWVSLCLIQYISVVTLDAIVRYWLVDFHAYPCGRSFCSSAAGG